MCWASREPHHMKANPRQKRFRPGGPHAHRGGQTRHIAPQGKAMSAHKRNTGSMLTSPRCGAKTRSGELCRSPAVSGKKRCRMHGGAPGSGAPKGNANALKHGIFTREAIAERRQVQELLRNSRKLLQQIK